VCCQESKPFFEVHISVSVGLCLLLLQGLTKMAKSQRF
jgi:hypothetical protein